MAVLFTARQRIEAAARSAGWKYEQGAPGTEHFHRDGVTLSIRYNARDGLDSATVTHRGGGVHPVGGGQQRLQKIVDLMHNTDPAVSGPHTWGVTR
jgi:hypothetical protein